MQGTGFIFLDFYISLEIIPSFYAYREIFLGGLKKFMDKLIIMKILLGDYMVKNNLTSRQVELLTGIPKSTINRIANNQISPRMDTMEQLARGLKIPISSLYKSDF